LIGKPLKSFANLTLKSLNTKMMKKRLMVFRGRSMKRRRLLMMRVRVMTRTLSWRGSTRWLRGSMSISKDRRSTRWRLIGSYRRRRRKGRRWLNNRGWRGKTCLKRNSSKTMT
jgi:hypothetical protein